MTRPNLTNFAITTLLGSITSTAGAFSVASMTGALFPSISSSLTIPYQPSNFVVAIDSELILCSGRSGDAFTVYTVAGAPTPTGRGWGGTAVAGHTGGAPVVLAANALNFNHIWSVLPDTYNPDVPSYAAGGFNNTTELWDPLNGGNAPSQWDDEFESFEGQGTPWTFTPLPTNLGGSYSGGSITVGSALRSCLVFSRNAYDTKQIWVSQPFVPNMAHPFTVTAKISHGAKLYGTSPVTMEAGIVVCDSTSFSSSSDEVSGNCVRFASSISGGYVSGVTPEGNAINFLTDNTRMLTTTSGSPTNIQYGLQQGAKYFQISYDGSNNYYSWVGDGITWRCMGNVNKTIPQINSLALNFHILDGATSTNSSQVAVVDWVRVTGGI